MPKNQQELIAQRKDLKGSQTTQARTVQFVGIAKARLIFQIILLTMLFHAPKAAGMKEKIKFSFARNAIVLRVVL
jgi:hypothetical protein